MAGHETAPELARPGVYILTGYKSAEDELPTVYIGESDLLRSRIDTHFQNKDFWDRGIVFTASNNGLNKAHVRWLESALVSRASQAKRCILDNGTEPQRVGQPPFRGLRSGLFRAADRIPVSLRKLCTEATRSHSPRQRSSRAWLNRTRQWRPFI